MTMMIGTPKEYRLEQLIATRVAIQNLVRYNKKDWPKLGPMESPRLITRPIKLAIEDVVAGADVTVNYGENVEATVKDDGTIKVTFDFKLDKPLEKFNWDGFRARMDSEIAKLPPLSQEIIARIEALKVTDDMSKTGLENQPVKETKEES